MTMSPVHEKVREICAEHFGAEAASRLTLGVDRAISATVARAYTDLSDQERFDLAFHLSDWRADAAFLVALVLAPERFSAEEAAEGISSFSTVQL